MKEIRIQSIDDISTIVKCFGCKLLKFIQLKKGKFTFYIKYKKFDGLYNIFYCNFQRRFEADIITSSQFYTFCIPTKNESIIVNDVQVMDNMLIIFPPNQRYQIFLKNTSLSYMLQVEKHIIEDKLGNLKYQVLEIENENVLENFIELLIVILHLDKLDLISIEESMINIIENLKIILSNNSCEDNKKVQLFRKIIQYMDQNYKEDLCIKEISDYFGISSRTMSNLFNEMIGYSPKKYLIANKINKFKIEIESNPVSLSISKLMINNNLQFQSQLSKDFKEFFCKTPSEYKKYIFQKNK